MPALPFYARPHLLRALRHRNFRLYFAGHAISTLGTWIQQVALAWLIYRLSGSAALLGLTTCVALLPQLLVAPPPGRRLDRPPRQSPPAHPGGEPCSACRRWPRAWLGWVNPALIIAMAALIGVLNAFDMPLRQLLFSQFVDDSADLPNALALNTSMFSTSGLIGQHLAGLFLAVFSEALYFAVKGVSYLALVIGSTADLHMAHRQGGWFLSQCAE